jgi:hypothetical protein
VAINIRAPTITGTIFAALIALVDITQVFMITFLQASLKEDDNSFSITYQNQPYSTSFLFALRRYLNGTSLDGTLHEIHVSDTYTRRIMYIR